MLPKIKSISAPTLKEWLDQDKAIVIDVRETAEFTQQRIENAINIPLSNIWLFFEKIEDFQNKNIVMQCKIGQRSLIACHLVQEKNEINNKYNTDNTYNLRGGIIS